jgi:hypothetical protein
VVAGALVAALAGPAAYSVATAATPHNGAIPSAGPAVAGGFGRPGPGGARGRFTSPPGLAGGGATAGQPGAFFGGGALGGGGRTAGGVGGAGGLLNGSAPSRQLTSVLEENASEYTWVAAAVGANQASGYQLATGDPVMAIGGFNGTDPAPTLAEFQAYVAAGRIHYFIAGGGFGGGFGGGSGASTSSQIASWVETNFTSTTVGGVTLYDLTSPA